MKYENINGVSQYNDIRENKIRQLRRPEKNKPLVIFFDGKNATKHHNYDMLSVNSFTAWMVRSMKRILTGYKGSFDIFAIIDEITVIFYDSESIAEFLNEDCIDSIYGLLMSRFTLDFNRHISCAFKGAAYFTDDIKKEIECRRIIGTQTALEYYAKEFMKQEYYHQKTTDQIISALKEQGYYEAYIRSEAFRNGLYFHKNTEY